MDHCTRPRPVVWHSYYYRVLPQRETTTLQFYVALKKRRAKRFGPPTGGAVSHWTDPRVPSQLRGSSGHVQVKDVAIR